MTVARTTRTKLKNTLVRAKIPVRARVAVNPVTTAAKARTPAKAKVAAQPMAQKCRRNPSRNRTEAPQPQWVGVEPPDPLFSLGKLLTCQQILSTDSQT